MDADELLFGWGEAHGIVSVWADREGRVVRWRREGGRVRAERLASRAWLFARHLADLEHLGARLAPAEAPTAKQALITYRLLSGAANSFRYLLEARRLRDLEQALLHGAARRLGQAPRSLNDLPDYYALGPVEQYLVASGEVYFRGLNYSDLHRMQIDFETTALDPREGRIFLAAIRDSHGFTRLLEAPEPGDEAALIRELVAIVRQRDPDVIENHNLFGFDLPFLIARAEVHGIALLLGRAEGPPGLIRLPGPPRRHGRRDERYALAGRELIDTLDAVRRHDFVARDLPSHRLKEVARHFGVARPERVYLAGAAIFSTYQQEPEQVRAYALDDVFEVDALSQRLLTPVFALAGMAPRRYDRLASAGPAMGVLEPILVRAYYRAGAALPGPDLSQPTTPHTGGALHLFAEGLARRVVKADIASLYPSLMSAEAIGPASDHLGAFVRVVQRITALRLFHKAARRDHAPGSLAAGHHEAMQAALKLIVNAAYGYLGAGSMALFADRDAADTVTRRGREVLDLVIAGLRRTGVHLIEADTDGVFFAVPADWDEAAERAAVAAVAGELPPGIRLEYEGRYAAMLSHEVKNYALLRYDGELIVRGAAFHSSRSEPFGAAFLREALAALLRDDLPGVYAALAATQAALRERRIPREAVASRARLTKSPAEYQRSRMSQREGLYEALLAAGQTDWEVGARVRFYRHEGGGYALLPEPTEERAAANDYDIAHYQALLIASYASRLRKAFSPEDFAQLTRLGGQLGLFDRPLEAIRLRWM